MTDVQFEKGNPVTGSWYICDRCFNKVVVERLLNQDGVWVCDNCYDLDLMAEPPYRRRRKRGWRRTSLWRTL